jgi:hypothetical protein
MLNFQAVRDKQLSITELVTGLSRPDLAALTQEMVTTFQEMIVDCTDADVTFEPLDPKADDPHASTPAEMHMPWSLGHVIVHCTASAEEAAVIAMELARGVAFHGRSRYETPWRGMSTIAGCRNRLQESQRIRLASLEMWPQPAHLDMDCEAWPGGPVVNAVGRFALGLMHDDGHLEQLKEIVHQVQATRQGKV